MITVGGDLLFSRYEQDEVRDGLARGAVRGKHEFIRRLSAEYDRLIRVDELVRPVAEEDDLRIGCGRGEDERWVLMERLPWDSDAFGCGVARLDAVVSPGGPVDLRADVEPEITAVEAALRLAAGRRVEYVFAVTDAQDLPSIRALTGAGFTLLETRLYYHMAITGPPDERFACRLAAAQDIPSLVVAAVESVNAFDRFHADPFISDEVAARIMAEWVKASIAGSYADATIVPDTNSPEAFCTAKYHREHWDGWGVKLSQPVLSAVSPNYRGWYVRIISELNEHLREVGADHSFLATQATNNAVIRSWEKLGYQYGKAEHVFRRLL